MNFGTTNDEPSTSSEIVSGESDRKSGYRKGNFHENDSITVSGISLQALVAELAPQKKYNTADFEYLQQLESERRTVGIKRKIELEKELKDFQKAKESLRKISTKPQPALAVKPVISKQLSSLIKIKPKQQ